MLAAVYTIVTVPETGFTPLVTAAAAGAIALLGAFLVLAVVTALISGGAATSIAQYLIGSHP